jgi:5-methylcytosine-specific restriction endonuclease McrA
MEQLSLVPSRLCPRCGGQQEWASHFSKPQWICRPCRAAATKRSQDRNREKIKARSKAWYRANKDRHKALVAAWNERNPGKPSEYERRSYLKNAEKRREKSRRWRQENPRAHDAQKARRRAAIKGNRTGPTPHWQIVQRLAIWAGECAYCGKKEQEQDHFIPLNRGGSHCVENIVPCCRSCNASKRDKDAWDWYCSQPFFAMQRWVKLVEVVGGADRELDSAA